MTRPPLHHLLAHASSQAAAHLLVALHYAEPRALLYVAPEGDTIAVRLGPRLLAAVIGRTWDARTEDDLREDARHAAEGWPVLRVSRQLCVTAPQRAVAEVLAAIHDRARVPDDSAGVQTDDPCGPSPARVESQEAPRASDPERPHTERNER